MKKTGFSIEFKQSFYRGYVHDIFVRFESPESGLSFREYNSSKSKDIIFTVKQKNIAILLFLDFEIRRKNSKFVTSVYRALWRFHSNVPDETTFTYIIL